MIEKFKDRQAVSMREMVDKVNEIIDLLEKKFPEEFEPELKPCPHCGGRNVAAMSSDEINHDNNGHDFTVCCLFSAGGCGATSGYRKTKKEAIEAWNRRANA